MRNAALATMFVAALLSVQCAAKRHVSSAQHAAAARDWDAAVTEYMEALKVDPQNQASRLMLVKALHEAAYAHIAKGQALADQKDWKGAMIEYDKAREYQPHNAYLATLIREAETMMKAAAAPEETIEEMPARPEPLLKSLPSTPVKLDFKSANVKDILRALGRFANVNFIFDDAVKDMNFSITLDNVSFESALQSIMLSTHHFYRVLDESTILISQDNAMKRRQLEQQQVRTFYVSNVELDEIRQLLQQTIGIKFIAVNKTLNAITVRDTPEKLRVAEQLIRSNDKSKAEILIELAIVEVNRQRVNQFGLDIGTNSGSQAASITGGFSPEGSQGGIIRGRDFLTANSLDYVFTLPTAAYKLLLSDSDSKIIASPKVRGVEGKVITLKMGDRVPIPVTTFTPIAGGGVNQQPITTFQYENIGINLDITPKVHRNNEITIDMKLDVSSISGTGFGGLPTFGNRQVTATLRLREGESNLLGGLLREEERKFVSGLPGIKDIPILGKLFSYNDTRKTQTDIVLSLTPHILRVPDIRVEDKEPIWIGTEENPSPMGPLPQMRRPFEEVEGPGGPLPIERPGRPGREPGIRRPDLEEEEPEELPEEELPPEDEEPIDETPRPQPGRASMILNPGSSEAAIGSQFSITLNLNGVENLSSVNLVLRYDPALMSIQDANVQEGNFMRQAGAAAFFKHVDKASGTVTLGSTATGSPKGVSGNGHFATLVFDAVAEGSATVRVERGTFTNAFYQPVAVDTSAMAEIEIFPEDEDPGNQEEE